MALFKRTSKTDAEKTSHFPGKLEVLDGLSAALEAERAAGSAIGTCLPGNLGEDHIGPSEETTGNINVDIHFDSPQGGPDLICYLDGLSLSGVRASGFTGGDTIAKLYDKLMVSVGMRASFVINHLSMSLKRQAISFQTGQDGCDMAGNAGVFQLFANNVQEAADFPLIAHRISELALNPGMCIQEGHMTSHALDTVLLPDAGLVSAYLGAPDDLVDCATESQKLLFGNKRRRIPILFDVDRPIGIGSIQDQSSYFRAVASQKAYFFDHIPIIAAQAMEEFARLTGRHYRPASGYRTEDADYVVLASGSVFEDLVQVVGYLRRSNIKAGVINVSLHRPFPGAQIAALLKGKKGATILERTCNPLSDETPILKEIRCALDKWTENGLDFPGGPANPGYPTFEKITDRPQVFQGNFGLGSNNPSFSDLVAVFENMVKAREQKKSFVLGIQFNQTELRLPGLERLQQSLKKGYPVLDGLGLKGEADNPKAISLEGRLEIRSHGDKNTLTLGNLLARSIYTIKGGRLKSQPGYGPNQGVWPDILSVAHNVGDQEISSEGINAVVLSSPELTFDPGNVCTGGVIVINSGSDHHQLLHFFSEVRLQKLRKKKIDVYRVDASGIAQDFAADLVEEKELTLLVLFGGLLEVYPFVNSGEMNKVLAYFETNLGKQSESRTAGVEDWIQAMRRGADEITILDLNSFDTLKRPEEEPETPWTVRAVRQIDGTLFDPVRHWETAGYLHEINRSDQFLTDPHVATGMVPPRATKSETSGLHRTRIPQLLAENCTACGACWTNCPASALPPAIHDITTLFETALKQCQEDGTTFIQLNRMKDQLIKQAYKLIEQDDLHQYLSLGKLCRDALIRLCEIAKLNEDQKQELEKEFQPVYSVIESFPIVRTDTFFIDPNKKKRGAGLLFSLGVNIDLCTECNLCVESCPENALEMERRDTSRLGQYKKNLKFQLKLPDVSQDLISEFQSEKQSDSMVYHLLNKKAYHTVIGANPDPAATGSNIAIHLMAASVEAVMQPRISAYVSKLSGLIDQLQEKIQGDVSAVVRINDFESMGEKLALLQDRDKLDLESLFEVIGKEVPDNQIERENLAKLAEHLTILKKLRKLYTEGPNGDGRANMALALGHQSIPFWPHNPYSFPWIHQDSGSSTAAIGILTRIIDKMADEFRSVRVAELLAGGVYEPETHDKFFENFGWSDLNSDERELIPPLIIDSGFEPGLFARILGGDIPVKILVMNTAAGENSDPAGLIGLTYRNAFVLQSSIGDPGHYISGLIEGMVFDGPALFHVFAPDPVRGQFRPDQVIECAKFALGSRAFPVFKYDPTVTADQPVGLDLGGNPDPGKDWGTVRPNGPRDNNLESKSDMPFGFADWAAGQGRFARHFVVERSGDSDQSMMPLYEYLAKSTEDRKSLKPFIEAVDQEGKDLRLVVSQKMTALTEARLNVWHLLQKLAGEFSGQAEPISQTAKTAMDNELDRLREELNTEFESRLAQQDKEHGRRYHARLTEKLMTLSGFGKDSDKLKATLRDFAKGDGDSIDET